MNHRWIARGLVVGLHVALLAALWLHQPARRDDTRDRRLTTVRLLQPKPRRTPPPASQAIAPPRTQAPALPDVAPPAFTTEPAPTAINSPAPPPSSEAPPAEPPRTALRLTLPPGYAASSAAARNPALSDPRSNTPRPTLEDRIADATGGTGAWVEEPVDNHAQSVGALGEYRTVLRKGNTCKEVFRSRISDSDPFNNSVAPRTVAMQGRAYKCK